MKSQNSFGTVALAAAMTVWMAAVAASASARRTDAYELPRDIAVEVFSREGGQTPQPPAKPPVGQPGQDQRGNQSGNQPAAAPAAPAPKPAIPAAASSIAAKPESFYGHNVTVYATVEKQLTPTAFTLDQDKNKSTGQEVIVLARRLHEPVPLNTYVTVMGEVVRPDPAELAKRAKEFGGGLPPEILAQHSNKPIILATAVITPSLNDLAKFIPPPMTPEEEVLDKAMKAVGQANGALRKGVDGTNAEIVKPQTAILAKAFAETEAFWKKRGNEQAVKIAQTARGAVDGLDKAAAMGNWNEAKTQMNTLGQQCQACHKEFRERLEDGSFAVRKGSAQ